MTNQEAIKVLNCTSLQTFCLCKVAIDGKMLSMKEALGMGIEALENQKTGHWIADVDKWGDVVTTINGYKCSECGKFNTDKDNYCPNCGTKMEGEQE